MSDWMSAHIDAHIAAGEGAHTLIPAVGDVGDMLIERFDAGGTLYTFGNGGSAADAQHLTGELIGHYKRDRRALPAITLSTDPTTMTCIANDYAYDDVFARQVHALTRSGDIVAAFTTSGRSPNITTALAAARANGATTILFGGGDGGTASENADYMLLAPSTSTPRIQEIHTLLLHLISERLDAWAAHERPE